LNGTGRRPAPAWDEFFLSHDPFNPNIVHGFYEREINYLTGALSDGGLGGTIVQIDNNPQLAQVCDPCLFKTKPRNHTKNEKHLTN